MMYLIAGIAGVFGLIIGSFLNVVIYRVPIGLSVATPASACPNCHAPIHAYDNVPVLSWLILRGRCRDCNTSISGRYPLVELGTGLLFFVVSLPLANQVVSAQLTVGAVTSGLALVAFLYLGAVSIALSFIDIEHHKLPDPIVLPSYAIGGILLGAAALVGGDYSALLRAGIGLAAMGIGYLAIAIIWPGGMGLGDVKLAGALGLYLGYVSWGSLIIGSIGAFVLGGIFGLVLIALRKSTRKSGIPFGPWMLLGAWIGILFGQVIWGGYLSLFGLSN